MKTFHQFCEDAAHEYAKGKEAYEKSGKTVRELGRKSAEFEADQREKSTEDFTERMKQRASTIRQISQGNLEDYVNRIKKQNQARHSNQESGLYAKAAKGLIKSSLKAGSKFIKNRMKKNAQSNSQRSGNTP